MPKKTKVLTRFILLISAILLSFFAAFFLVILSMQRQMLLTHRQDEESKLGVLYDQVIKRDTNLLTATIDLIAEDQAIKDIYLENDRAKLLTAVAPLSQKLKDEYDITHFTFIHPDGTVFLRPHEPEAFGDTVTESVFRRAAETGQEATGIELGANAFALRAIAPYYDGDKLVGYIEFGEEIGHILTLLHTKTGDEFIVFGDRKGIDVKGLQAARAQQGLSGEVAGLTEHILISETSGTALSSYCLTEDNIAKAEKTSISIDEKLPNGTLSGCVGIPMVGLDGRTYGAIFAIFDQTTVMRKYEQVIVLLAAESAAVTALSLLFIYLMVSRLILKPLGRLDEAASDIAGGNFGKRVAVTSTDEIGRLGERFNSMAGELGRKSAELDKLINHLEETVEARTEALRGSETKYRSLIESVQVCIKVMDRDFKVVSINRYGAEEHMLTGLSQQELHEYDIMSTIVEADREKVLAALRNAFAGISTRLEVRHVPGTSTNSDCLAIISPITGGNNDQVLFLSSDISGMKKAEGQVRELDQLKNKFIQIVSHQLRTPLSVVRWNLEAILSGEMGKLKEAQKEFLHLTYEANGEIISRINDLLTALDIEEGKLAVTKNDVSLESLSKSAYVFMEKKCVVKEISCKYSGLKGSLPVIQADAEKIRKAMEHLCQNALEYTAKGGHMAVSLSKKGRWARFEVRDTGIGIPEAEQSNIFGRFFRASNAFSVRQDASGLGLYITKHFVEQHRGRIGFNSREGKGSTFWFELPLEDIA